MTEQKRLLVIQPHPDDMAFFTGGTIAAYASRGIETHVLTLTDGERGSVAVRDPERGFLGVRRPEAYELEWMKILRQQEDARAAEILGVASLTRSHIPDKEMEENAIPVIRQTILRVNPHVIVTFGELGTTHHPDHAWAGIATYYAALTLMRSDSFAEYLRLARYLTITVPQASRTFSLYGEIDDPAVPTTSIDVSSFLQTKLDASAQYETQEHLFRFFAGAGLFTQEWESFIERIARAGIGPATGDFFRDTDGSYGEGVRITTGMPLPAESYITNAGNASALLVDRIERAESFCSQLYGNLYKSAPSRWIGPGN